MCFVKIVINFRKSLLHLVNITENDYVLDDELPDITVVTDDGKKNAWANIHLWQEFLCPPEDSKKHQQLDRRIVSSNVANIVK